MFLDDNQEQIHQSMPEGSKQEYLPYGLFATNYDVPDDTPIVALSDIHADMDALIIAFRDCAKVITKNNIATELDTELKKIIQTNQIDVNICN